ncbi:helix-turn-helix domain-containing protein [Halodesulfovibrio aestuarii]|uniref:helix-turn-helix domain-containing protein n=1 Tax=Halodesulfovibrio aestuarii TaxID=126333 RepID=UPI003D32EE94
MNTISERIRSIRGNTSRAAFAKRFGIHAQTLIKYESGERMPSVELIQTICQQEEILAEWLLFGTGEMRQSDISLQHQAFPKQALTPTSVCPRCEALEADLRNEREEVRELSKELRELNAENRTILKENGKLKEEIGLLKGELKARAAPTNKATTDSTESTTSARKTA